MPSRVEQISKMFLKNQCMSRLLNLDNPSPNDNTIASLMNATVRHEEPSGQKLAQHTVQVMAIPEITSISTITVPPPPPFFNALQQQATPTPTPMTFEPTTSFPTLLDFSSVFKFNERVTNLEHNLSEMKQVNQYAQALSSIPAIEDCHIDNKLGEAIQSLINLIDSMVRAWYMFNYTYRLLKQA
nr:hypothetical protein [Tanacetum cinerariifolium]